MIRMPTSAPSSPTTTSPMRTRPERTRPQAAPPEEMLLGPDGIPGLGLPAENPAAYPYPAALDTLCGTDPARALHEDPIYLHTMAEPVHASDGFTYDLATMIALWLDGQRTSPLTRRPLGSIVYRNLAVSQALGHSVAPAALDLEALVASVPRAEHPSLAHDMNTLLGNQGPAEAMQRFRRATAEPIAATPGGGAIRASTLQMAARSRSPARAQDPIAGRRHGSLDDDTLSLVLDQLRGEVDDLVAISGLLDDESAEANIRGTPVESTFRDQANAHDRSRRQLLDVLGGLRADVAGDRRFEAAIDSEVDRLQGR